MRRNFSSINCILAPLALGLIVIGFLAGCQLENLDAPDGEAQKNDSEASTKMEQVTDSRGLEIELRLPSAPVPFGRPVDLKVIFHNRGKEELKIPLMTSEIFKPAFSISFSSATMAGARSRRAVACGAIRLLSGQIDHVGCGCVSYGSRCLPIFG